jgi:hypothetical protein
MHKDNAPVPAHTDSAVARLIDSYERAVRRLSPHMGLRPSHLFSGGLFGFMGALLGTMPWLVRDHGGWWIVAAVTLASAALQSVVAAGRWNRLYAQCFDAQRRLVRSNLLDHELLLLAMEEELPARYDKLRRVAQSHGKTRARNYMELRKGSMADRVQWLAENYRVLCPPLGLQPLVPALAAGHRRRQALLLAPPVLMVLCLVLLAVLLSQGLAVYVKQLLPAVMGCSILLLGWGLGPEMQQQELERGALLSVLVELLDLTDPAPQPATDDTAALTEPLAGSVVRSAAPPQELH